MSRYNDLCQAYFEWEPHQAEIDRIFRSIPLRMRQAVEDHLDPPAKTVAMPTMAMDAPIAYAELYRASFGQNGEKKWERCADNNCWQIDADGIRQFIIGIWMERTPGSLSPSVMYFTFSVESITLESAELRIENLASRISIDLRDPQGFAQAAEKTIDLLIEFLKSPPDTLGDRIPIGFAAPTQSAGLPRDTAR